MSDQEKLARVLDFLAKGLDSLGEQLQETSKAIVQFQDAIKNAKSDLSGIVVAPTVKKGRTGLFGAKAGKTGTVDKQAAANTLIGLLGGSGSPVKAPGAAAAGSAGGGLFGGGSAAPSGLPGAPGLPTAPRGPTMGLSLGGESDGPKPGKLPGGLPSAPGGLPTAPAGLPGGFGMPGAPSGMPGAPAGLPGIPSMPKSPGPPGLPGGAPPVPSMPMGGGIPAPPGPPGPPSMGGSPMGAPAGGAVPAVAAGGAFKSLRDEMLSELNRLKKIMGGAK